MGSEIEDSPVFENIEASNKPSVERVFGEPSPTTLHGFDTEQLLTVSTIMNKVDECVANEPTDECLICFDNMVDISLPCAHSFCSQCIDTWVSQQRTCPTCREQVTDTQHELWQFTEIPNVAQIDQQLIDLATGNT